MDKESEDWYEEIARKDWEREIYKECDEEINEKYNDFEKKLVLLLDEAREKILFLKKELEKEICICAAVIDETGYIWRGHRHCDCLQLLEASGNGYGGSKSQGFMTSKNRFVTREEGMILQTSAGIESKGGGYRGDRLFSEDLY